MKLNIFSLIAFACLISIASCKKEKTNVVPDNGQHNHEDSNNVAKEGTFEIHFNNKSGDKVLELGTAWYTTHSGDSFQVSLFNYYISNIVLHKMDGGTYVEPESYHLIKGDDASSQIFSFSHVPAGHYVGISFVIGVDESRNTAGAQTGALDPIHGMFWSWNTGYIMAKMEGKTPKAANGNIKFHIGGFSGTNNVLKNLNFNFTEHKVVDNNTIHLHFNADVQKWFHGVHHIDLATTNDIHMPGAKAKMVADNYANMFTVVDHH